MKKVTIIAVGKIKEKYLEEAIEEYKKRLSRFCELAVIEISAKDKKSESDTILKYDIDFLMDINGELVSSPDLSRLTEERFVSGSDTVTFIIGGSDGVDERVRFKAKKALSFGRITYPHQLMRVILLEQIYRSFTISSNMPYHK